MGRPFTPERFIEDICKAVDNMDTEYVKRVIDLTTPKHINPVHISKFRMFINGMSREDICTFYKMSWNNLNNIIQNVSYDYVAVVRNMQLIEDDDWNLYLKSEVSNPVANALGRRGLNRIEDVIKFIEHSNISEKVRYMGDKNCFELYEYLLSNGYISFIDIPEVDLKVCKKFAEGMDNESEGKVNKHLSRNHNV